MKTLSRSSGRSATAAAAYRAGQKIEDERTGQTYDYSKRSGVLLAEVMTPDGQPLDRAQLWNAAESAEKRCNSVVAREFVVALPHELTQSQQTALVKDYAQGLSERTGWAVDVAIHAPGNEGDLRNMHAHLLCTTRTIERDPAGCPVAGSKTREWDIRSSGSELLRSERSEWERCVNQSLELANRIERVDCRSHAERQTGLEPQIHLGPTAMNMERKGIQTERGDEHRRIAAHNGKVIELSQVREARTEEENWQRTLEQMQSMPLEQLRQARERHKPQGVNELVEEDPKVKAARCHFDDLKAAHAELDKGIQDCQYGIRLNEAKASAYREEHPWKARLHDFKILPDQELSERTATIQSLSEEKTTLETQRAESGQANMQAFHALDQARGEAIPKAIERHGLQSERFRQVEAIYQPRKEQQIAQELAQKREQELARQQQREKERERGGGGRSIGW